MIMHEYGRGVDLDHERAPLRSEPLQAAVSGSALWTSVRLVAETGSTNADLIAEARSGAAEGLVLVAEHQVAGRGRAGRDWTSVPGAGLAVSVLLRPGAATGRWPAVPATGWGWLPLLTGVALAEAVTRTAGVRATLKWPNDLLLEPGKAGGILAEVAGNAVVVGAGLNVTLRADECPPARPGATALPVTSLALAGARTTDRVELLAAFLRRLEGWYAAWRGQVGDPHRSGLRDAYLAACVTVGQPVRALLPGNTQLLGTADTVDEEGRLVLRTPQGIRTLAAGDITHLRPEQRRARRQTGS